MTKIIDANGNSLGNYKPENGAVYIDFPKDVKVRASAHLDHLRIIVKSKE